jgi:NAD(P)-dependent dehydrogenase (short-subunit alcohol dehydrogenase family)
MTSVDLTGKVVAVTGGFGALGQAVSSLLAEAGAKVALIDHAPAPAAQQPSGALVYGAVDLADEQSAVALMRRIIGETGRLDALVNIAGGFNYETLEGGTLDTWDFLYRINVRTAVTSTKAALPYLLSSGAGRVVNIGALGAIKAAAGMGPYAASKSGVARFTEALAAELKDRGVTVNAVLPSILDTARNRLDMPDADFSRWVTPRAMGEVIAFLLSDVAAVITGALIPVAGRA